MLSLYGELQLIWMMEKKMETTTVYLLGFLVLEPVLKSARTLPSHFNTGHFQNPLTFNPDRIVLQISSSRVTLLKSLHNQQT